MSLLFEVLNINICAERRNFIDIIISNKYPFIQKITARISLNERANNIQWFFKISLIWEHAHNFEWLFFFRWRWSVFVLSFITLPPYMPAQGASPDYASPHLGHRAEQRTPLGNGINNYLHTLRVQVRNTV